MKDGTDYAEKNGMFFIETSAKTADNINELFEVRSVFTFFWLLDYKINRFILYLARMRMYEQYKLVSCLIGMSIMTGHDHILPCVILQFF